MADLSDVLTALVNIAAGAVYPSGTSQPSVLGGSAGIRCFSGWPDPNTLNADLAAGNVTVSVYPMPTERNTTRYPNDWQESSVNAASLTLTVLNATVTVGGTITVNEAAVVIVNGTPYARGVQAGDTLNTLATALAALIPGASAVGAVVTVPVPRTLTAVVAVQGVVSMEIRRQERLFQITIWAPTFTARDLVAKVVDLALAKLERITLSDNTSALLIYHNSPQTDLYERMQLYRRDLIYSVEYATVMTAIATQVVAPVVNVTGQNTYTNTVTIPAQTVNNL